MSEDGQSDPLDDPPMEVTVETLTGTVFDVRVYPTETILDIKNKIQRVEGKYNKSTSNPNTFFVKYQQVSHI